MFGKFGSCTKKICHTIQIRELGHSHDLEGKRSASFHYVFSCDHMGGSENIFKDGKDKQRSTRKESQAKALA